MRKSESPDQKELEDDFAAEIRGAEDALLRVKEAEVKAEAAKRPPLDLKRIFYAALIGTALLVIYLGLPELRAANFYQKPMRAGSYLTDTRTDHCIQNLWDIAAAMRAGIKPPALTCPAAGTFYAIETDFVRCPNPALHGALKLYADKKNVIPFLKK